MLARGACCEALNSWLYYTVYTRTCTVYQLQVRPASVTEETELYSARSSSFARCERNYSEQRDERNDTFTLGYWESRNTYDLSCSLQVLHIGS